MSQPQKDISSKKSLFTFIQLYLHVQSFGAMPVVITDLELLYIILFKDDITNWASGAQGS